MSGIYKSLEGQEAVLAQYAELLDRWLVPCEHRRVSTCEGETFIVACGPTSAPPILLFQGSGANTRVSRYFAPWTR